MSSLFKNNATAAPSAPPTSLAGSSSDIGSSLIRNLPRQRRIVNREFGFTAELPFGCKDAASTAAYAHVVDEGFLDETLGGEYDGSALNPKNGMLVSFRVTAHNDSKFPVALSFPGLAQVEAHRIGGSSVHSGAITLKPGETKERELISDESIVDDQGVTNITAFSIKQLGKCEHEGDRGEWEVYARMVMSDGSSRINPVLEEMHNAGKLDSTLWERIASATSKTKVNVTRSTYETFKAGIEAQHQAIGDRLTDLTKFVCVVERADNKMFAEMPDRLAKAKGTLGDQHRDEFRSIPPEVHCDVEIEYASDAITSE